MVHQSAIRNMTNTMIWEEPLSVTALRLKEDTPWRVVHGANFYLKVLVVVALILVKRGNGT